MASLKMREESLKLDLGSYPHIPNSELFKIAKCLPKLHAGGPWIAGGSVWRTVNNEPLINCDVDVFFICKEQYEEMCAKMKSYPYVNNILSEKKNKWNTTFQLHVNEGSFNKTIDVQFIGMSYYNRLEKLLNSFDFPVCQFGYNGKDILVGEKSLSDLQKRQLSIHRLAHPKSFLKHMLKYLNNGFTLPTEELKNITERILEINAWSKNATGKYDECNDVCGTVECGVGMEERLVQAERWITGTGINSWRSFPTDTVPPTNRNGDTYPIEHTGEPLTTINAIMSDHHTVPYENVIREEIRGRRVNCLNPTPTPIVQESAVERMLRLGGETHATGLPMGERDFSHVIPQLLRIPAENPIRSTERPDGSWEGWGYAYAHNTNPLYDANPRTITPPLPNNEQR